MGRRIHQKYPQIPVSTIRYTIISQDDRKDHISKPRSDRPPVPSPEQKTHLHQLAIEDPHIKMCELQAAVDSTPSKSTVPHLSQPCNLYMKKWNRESSQKLLKKMLLNILLELSIERGKGARSLYTFNSPCCQPIEHDIHAIRCGKGVKQMFWTGFQFDKCTGLVPLLHVLLDVFCMKWILKLWHGLHIRLIRRKHWSRPHRV
ncbi:hypothetical protein MAP00_009285 [Monascus purpureus]|nr:hypothetical protein MAP00_009285 [Monascus purpureus]